VYPPNVAIYCTYSDINYLPRLIALLDSLISVGDNSVLQVLALDDSTRRFFEARPRDGVHIVSIDELEARFPELSGVRDSRTKMEYVFTLTPFLMRFLVDTAEQEEPVIYLDADLYFFEDTSVVLRSLEGADVGIIPHSYPIKLAKSLAKYGRFNVGLVAIRNSELGRKCLDWWASQCLDWCGDEPVDGKYADQGYLDQFPSLFEGVKILENRGFNLAPWNTSGQVISSDSEGNVILGDHTPLTFFHFHGLKRFGNWMVTSQLNYRSPASKSLMELVYEPYLRALRKAEKSVENKIQGRPAQKLVRGKGLRKLARNLSSKLLMVASVITGNAVHMSRLE
jgi:hypothetical protein